LNLNCLSLLFDSFSSGSSLAEVPLRQDRTIRLESGHLCVRVPGMLVLVAALAVIPVTAGATSIVHRTVQEMTAGSALVIQGVVTGVRQSQKSTTGLPARKVSIAVERVLKGFASAPTITISIPGGVRNGMVMNIPGMPAFVPGEEVVVFLERTPAGWIPMGLANGKFSIVTDQAGRRLALRNARELNRVNLNASVTRSAREESDVVTYDDLLRMIDDGKAASAARRVKGGAASVGAVKGGAR
jgi:hypothetical protein